MCFGTFVRKVDRFVSAPETHGKGSNVISTLGGTAYGAVLLRALSGLVGRAKVRRIRVEGGRSVRETVPRNGKEHTREPFQGCQPRTAQVVIAAKQAVQALRPLLHE